MNASAIILAAGKSTRLKSRLPKPLHEICGRPMLHYVLQACFSAGCQRVMVVVGHGKQQIIDTFGSDKRIIFVEQTEQLGTGHAARMCQPHLQNQGGDVFILAGDGPLIRGQVLQNLLETHRREQADASMATAELDNPFGYGRIIRDAAGQFEAIVEEPDCTDEQRLLREVFPSYYCVKSEQLLWALGQLTNNNRKNEYYLTDIYEILRRGGRKVAAVRSVAADDVIGVNTRAHLALVDGILQRRLQQAALESGVTLTAPQTIYIESDVTFGPDTVIEPHTFIGRGGSIGSDCRIGPFAMIQRDSVVPDGSVISGNITSESTVLNK